MVKLEPPQIALIACVCCCLIIVIVSLSVSLSIRAEETCSDKPFHDLPSEYWVEQEWYSQRARSTIYNRNRTEIGSFTRKPLGTSTKYRYRDYADNVVAKADRGALSRTFYISRCDEKGDKYELYKHFWTLGKVVYDLKKNGELIGQPTKKTWFKCKPDIVLEDTNEELLASIGRSCGESWFVNKWNIANYQPDKVDNYVLGFIAYITTQEEKAEREAQENNNNHH